MADFGLTCSIFLAVDESRESLDLRSLASMTSGVNFLVLKSGSRRLFKVLFGGSVCILVLA